ncbi:RNA polymerase sigma factor [Streptomyces venezuelae]|uniref:RNA polymerase sigma factor n=1 Tax=Streptomyces venezuelae TaxID=54571 RepID=UPI00168131B7|nr:ECF-type sigma factor [Streptomyces venezuelae]
MTEASSPHEGEAEASDRLRQELKNIHPEFMKQVVPRLRSSHPSMSVVQCHDAGQAAYVKILKSEQAGTLRAPKNLMNTLLRAAEQCAIDEWRKTGRYELLATAQELEPWVEGCRPDDGPRLRLDQEVLPVVEAMQPTQRLTVGKLHLAGYSNREIAVELGISTATVATQLYRFRRELLDGVDKQKQQRGDEMGRE